jgi:hypothetical protein
MSFRIAGALPVAATEAVIDTIHQQHINLQQQSAITIGSREHNHWFVGETTAEAAMHAAQCQ